MDKNFEEAFSEVLEVINHSENKIKDKIPNKFIEFLKQNKDKEYVVKIDFKDENWQETVKEETLTILALIYRDYIVSPEKRQELLREEQEEIIKTEKALREKYNPDDIFKKEKNNISSQNTEESVNVDIVVKKESIFDKVKKWLKSILNKYIFKEQNNGR